MRAIIYQNLSTNLWGVILIFKSRRRYVDGLTEREALAYKR